MHHMEFRIGHDFTMSGKRYRCTDVGTRTIVAIKISGPQRIGTINSKTGFHGEAEITAEKAEADGWFTGPPYAVDEFVLDEDDFDACEAAPVPLEKP